MKISYDWLQEYFSSPLPSPKELAELLTFHAYEVESIDAAEGDTILTVDILPNRAGDSLSHRGIAKELSALLRLSLAKDPLSGNSESLKESAKLMLDIGSDVPCDRYSGAFIEHITVSESPEWLKKRLRAIGQKPINSVVDAVNYVMFDTGQPLHAFDADKISDKDGAHTIRIRFAREGERIETLDGAAPALSPENLLIVDGGNDAPLGIAGVKGGIHAAISAGTKNIILESAHFNATAIRRSSQKSKIRTDASVRFENDPPPELTRYALSEAAALIGKLSGGRPEGYKDFYPRPSNPYKVGVSTSELRALLGVNISEREVGSILHRLSFAYELIHPLEKMLRTAETLLGAPYVYGASIRKDAPGSFDCSSFVGFIFMESGIRIPRVAVDQYLYGSAVKKASLKAGDVVFSVDARDAHIRHKTAGFFKQGEVPQGVSHCGLYVGKGDVIHASGARGKVVKEKLSRSESFKHIVGFRRMITNSEPRFVVTIPFERRDVRLKEDVIEEVGRIYGYGKIAPRAPRPPRKKVQMNKTIHYMSVARKMLVDMGFSEVYTYAFRKAGTRELLNPLASDKKFLRPHLRDGLEESISMNARNKDVLGLHDVRIFEFGNVFLASEERLVLGIAASDSDVMRGIVIPSLKNMNNAALFSLNGNVLEMDFGDFIKELPRPRTLFAAAREKVARYVPFSEYPFVLRDIALWVPLKTSADSVRRLIEKQCGKLLIRVTLFDTFKKDKDISYAFRLVFQSPEKTLSDAEIGALMENVARLLNSKEGWRVR